MTSKAAAIQSATTHFLQYNIQWASLTVLYYDYALTLPMEVKYMWGAKLRLSTILYIFCRHAMLGNVLYLLAISQFFGAGDSCDIGYKVVGAIAFFGRGSVIVTFAMRTYAIFGKSRWILAYFTILGTTCMALDIMHLPGLRCVGSSSIHIANQLLSILMVVFEYSAAILTTFRCVQAFRINGSWTNQKGALLYMIFQQGILYFSIVSLITTAAVVLNYRAPAGFLQRLLNAFLLPLSGLLTARFLLHLRAWEDKQNYGTSGEGPRRTHTDTIGSFHAAPGRGQTSVLSAIIEEFGTDPVARAVAESAQAREVGLATMKTAFEGSSSSGDTSSGGPSSSSWVIR